MRNIILIITVLSLVALSHSCLEDKGNYSYSEPFEITVNGLDEAYCKITMVDSFIFTPQISPENREYSYFWGIYESYAQGYTPKMDTICYTKNLIDAINLPIGNYTLVFGIKDCESGYCHLQKIELQIESELTTGWYLLKDDGVNTDIDVYTQNEKLENVIATANKGYQLLGKASTMLYIPYDYMVLDTLANTYKSETVMAVLSEKDANIIRVEDGKIIRHFDDMFYFPPAVKHPTDIFFGDNSIYLINDDKIHYIDKSGENTGRFGEAIIDNYCITHRVSTDFSTPVLWDEISASFKSVNSYDSRLIPFTDNPETGLPPINNLDAELLFMGASGFPDKAICLLKKRKSGEYELRILNAGYLSSYRNNTLVNVPLESNHPLTQAQLWATDINSDILYYIFDQQIYSCDLNDQYLISTPQLSPFPVNEEITFIRNLTFSTKAYKFNYLAIATHTNGKYKLYLYTVENGVLQPDPRVLEGNGKVKKVMYINNGNYSNILM